MATVNTIKDRINGYKSVTDYKLTARLPVAVILNGRSFSKATSLLEKPFSNKFMEVMSTVLIKLSHDVDGCVFSYSFNDEIILILRNDQSVDTEIWYENSIQKMVSAISSIATLQFNKMAASLGMDIVGEPIFLSECFALPSIQETISFLSFKQQQAFHNSISLACFHELLKKYNFDTVKSTLTGRSPEEKLEILNDECNVNYNDYPLAFKRGIACYRVPKLITTKSGETFKNKWAIDTSLPIFSKDDDLLANIFKSGRDIFRANRDI